MECDVIPPQVRKVLLAMVEYVGRGQTMTPGSAECLFAAALAPVCGALIECEARGTLQPLASLVSHLALWCESRMMPDGSGTVGQHCAREQAKRDGTNN